MKGHPQISLFLQALDENNSEYEEYLRHKTHGKISNQRLLNLLGNTKRDKLGTVNGNSRTDT